MEHKETWIKKPSVWALALGVAIGGVSVAGYKTPFGIGKAMAAGAPQNHTVANISPQSMAILHDLDNSYSALAQAVEPAVVQIRVSANPKANGAGFGFDGGGMNPGISGEGSGVIFRPDGYIITNDHVVNGMDKVTVVLNDGRQLPGKVIRSDQSGDIAVVKIEANNLPTLQFADSNDLKVGQMTMAIGSPFDLDNSVSFGHVSALDREQQIPDERLPGNWRVYPDLLQTDAAINPGNSGGALVNIEGQVIGINTAIASNTGASNGIGFAIPSNQARMIAEMLIKNGTVQRAFMGLVPEPLKQVQEQQLGIDHGAYVALINNGTPAADAGIQKGDVITQIGSMPIQTYMDLRNAMYRYQPGEKVDLQYWRDGKTHSATVTLGKVPPIAAPAPQAPQMQNPFGNDSPFKFNFPGARGGKPQVDSTPRSGPVKLGAEVAAVSDDLRAQFKIPAGEKGVVVLQVEPGSVADRQGLQAGDVIESVDGVRVTTPEQIGGALKNAHWGGQGSISYKRWADGGEEQSSEQFQF